MNNSELEREHLEFVIKTQKTCNDLIKDYKNLSSENQIRVKAELRQILPAGFIDLIKFLQN